MNKIFLFRAIAASLILAGTLTLHAQTLEQGRDYINKKEYSQAKIAFDELIKKYPKRADVNKWYGEALYETGDYAEAEKYLTFAAKNRVQTSFLYLANTCVKLYQFDRAIENYKVYLSFIKKKPEETAEVERLIENAELLKTALDRVENIQIIDSIIVNKAEFFNYFKLSDENGHIISARKANNKYAEQNKPVFETQRGDRQIYSVLTDNNYSNIASRNKLHGNEWSEQSLLPEPINSDSNDAYPYLLSDGMTLYFGSDRQPSFGGYDIFITKYNPERNSYLIPSRLPMPFNSPFNDYMMAIDEDNNVGWFVSDRFQSDDNVIIYLFIPNNDTKEYHLGKTTEDKISFARINSLKDTWTEDNDYESILQKVYNTERNANVKKIDFTFIVNDKNVYHTLDDFKTKDGKQLFTELQSAEKILINTETELENFRKEWAKANEAYKTKNRASILALENRVKDLKIKISEIENRVREAELKNKKKGK